MKQGCNSDDDPRDKKNSQQCGQNAKPKAEEEEKSAEKSGIVIVGKCLDKNQSNGKKYQESGNYVTNICRFNREELNE